MKNELRMDLDEVENSGKIGDTLRCELLERKKHLRLTSMQMAEYFSVTLGTMNNWFAGTTQRTALFVRKKFRFFILETENDTSENERQTPGMKAPAFQDPCPGLLSKTNFIISSLLDLLDSEAQLRFTDTLDKEINLTILQLSPALLKLMHQQNKKENLNNETQESGDADGDEQNKDSEPPEEKQ